MKESSICPHLGKQDDRFTPILYPSEANCCHRDPNAIRPSLTHQDDWCLGADHPQCPVFLNGFKLAQQANATSAAEVLSSQTPNRKLLLGVGLALIIAGLVFGWQVFFPGFGPAGLVPKASVVEADGFMPVQTSEPTAEVVAQAALPTATIMLRTTPTPFLAPTITPYTILVGFNQPFGSEIKFIVHQIAQGETFEMLSRTYNTTFIAIQKINASQLTSFGVGSVLIIPLDIENIPAGTPVFTPMQLEAEMMVRDLAAKIGGVVNEVTKYNGLNEEDILAKGSWVIVPGSK